MEAVCELPLGVSWPAASEDLSALPRNERVSRVCDAIRAMTDQRGVLLPVPLVHELLGVSAQRVGQILEQGHLERVKIHGRDYIPEDSLVHYVNTERKNGRPFKMPGKLDLAKRAYRAAKEITK